MYSCREGKLLGTCGLRGGSSATVAALVEEEPHGRLFLPILDAALETGARVGLLAWRRSKRFVRVREAVGTRIGGGGGRAFGVL